MYVIETSRLQGGVGNLMFIVGCWHPTCNKFIPIRDCDCEEEAWKFIHFLNGGILYDYDGSYAVQDVDTND